MKRMPDHLKPVQARRERYALATLAGAMFEWRWASSRAGYQPKQWFIAWLPLRDYVNGPFATKWEAVESAIKQLESPNAVFTRSVLQAPTGLDGSGNGASRAAV